ncbi:biotin synthase [Ehrlichia chaffeensis str. Heartland]|uniref:Biotin synthase n=1 Tax=Ehrlichia chaffeensis (strain ATCC CRL-10679 / Arkansas) TaxID=205920 RepID=BIOB_EHRCR|nr:biotin synthase BioB [Ehrlichia chaffeensis]Q2GHB1.1 RecName: Full=Biotin synthase [Ehrlichia chaffeensis str. Arkansas]ABD45247.1 biotin synthase [Ehrlichia chaffeensis str. Arkansas]AHX03465.1 biotin synthase [Ehrlichia chaffeensis str. Heartland]AHX05815.1 biotin synthase [Ehrlichia chaffeensis str. Jax]AHX06807.1 biotin synthase [Ehrlichia chaffeensis str. Liberty]AHX07868.1 biotin synthase [Ehrlichia chaffeensis str. Osceola]
MNTCTTIRNNWQLDEILELFNTPFNDLILRSHLTHRQFFNNNEIQLAALLNIKTGGCPENCRYCSQSAHYKTDLQKEALLDVENIKKAIQTAKNSGADRFCFAAAWRQLRDKDIEYICNIINLIKSEKLESCASLGMITLDQAKKLKNAGLDFYNHNIDTSRDFYSNVTTTRNYDDRLASLNNIYEAGINICSGGILGLGESIEDRAKMLLTLANLKEHPRSVPINRLVPIKGTPFENNIKVDNIDFIKTIAVTRILMPKSYVRLAAGRKDMSEEMQALCLFAGANSIFYGEKLLTTPNSNCDDDKNLLSKLGIKTKEPVLLNSQN